MALPGDSIHQSWIWLPEVDSKGRRLHPAIREAVQTKQSEMARYRSTEMTDNAQIATLIEEAAYRASEAAYRKELTNPSSYLFRIYANLVDAALRRSVRSLGMEEQVLSHLAKLADPERALVNRLTSEKLISSMDEKGRNLWERHLLGFEIDELAAEEGQTSDYVGKRLRRAVERALNRLLG